MFFLNFFSGQVTDLVALLKAFVDVFLVNYRYALLLQLLRSGKLPSEWKIGRENWAKEKNILQSEPISSKRKDTY